MQTLPSLLLRERVAILAGLIGLAALSWAYLYRLARDMADMDMAAMAMSAAPRPWAAADAALMFAMWAVMMVAMMLPSAAPMILTFATVNRRKRAQGRPFVPTAVFAAGYLVAWAAFGLAATLVQWGLERAVLMSDMMEPTTPILGGVLFVAAGIYQVTPLKHVCLARCRSPLDFVLNRWRDGAGGALRMGLAHGLHCLGCCWVLMGLLFAGGVMNLLWVAAIAGFVLIEKLVAHGDWLARVSGAAMVAYGAALLAQP